MKKTHNGKPLRTHFDQEWDENLVVRHDLGSKLLREVGKGHTGALTNMGHRIAAKEPFEFLAAATLACAPEASNENGQKVLEVVLHEHKAALRGNGQNLERALALHPVL